MELIKRIRGFIEGAKLDTLHPSHGPFPDYVAEYEEQEHWFLVCVWVDADSWIVLVEGPPLEGPEVWTAGLISTYRWRPGSDRSQAQCNTSPGHPWWIEIPLNCQGDETILPCLAVASITLYLTVQR